jgi:hypothetical protein
LTLKDSMNYRARKPIEYAKKGRNLVFNSNLSSSFLRDPVFFFFLKKKKKLSYRQEKKHKNEIDNLSVHERIMQSQLFLES